MKKCLDSLHREGNFRRLPKPNQLIDFASNNYLGLASSTGSRLLTGNSPLAEQLEESISAFHGYAAGLLFTCGYMANIGLISAVASENDTIFYDEHVHASTHDGIRLSRAKSLPFRHNDVDHLKKRLKGRNSASYICIESLYSIEGDFAPLQEIAELSTEYGAKLIVDEAHATGVFGPAGKGLVAEHALQSHVFAHVVTFGKALGAHGAIILGSLNLKDTLINYSRPFIYTTALPESALSAIKRSYELFPSMDKERRYLQQLFKKSPIYSVKIPGNTAAKSLSQHLAMSGFDTRPILSPTAQRGSESLRICLHTYNSQEDVNRLVECIERYR